MSPSSESGYYSSSSSSSSSIKKPVPLNTGNVGGLVLVTGGSGFIASHIIYQLFQQGYKVRTSVRDVEKHLPFLKTLGHISEKDVFKMDLNEKDQSKWDKLVEGCDYVIHTASPFTYKLSESELIGSAVNATERMMHAVANAKHHVKKTIVTSSVAACAVGHKKIKKPLDDDSWSIDAFVHGYDKSKYLAEKKAWEIAHEKKILLETVCPGFVVGPILGKHQVDCQSSQMVAQLLKGGSKAVNIRLPYVDVRDVATVHVAALTHGRLTYEDCTPIPDAFDVQILDGDDEKTIKKKKKEIKDHNKKLASAWDYGIIYGNRYVIAGDDGLNVGMLDACEVLSEFSKDGGCNYSPTKSKVPDWVATMFANVMPIKNAKYWINFTVPVDTRLTTRVLKVNLGSYKKALCDHALSLMAMKAVDLNGYNQAKVSDFSPYNHKMEAWKAYVHSH